MGSSPASFNFSSSLISKDLAFSVGIALLALRISKKASHVSLLSQSGILLFDGVVFFSLGSIVSFSLVCGITGSDNLVSLPDNLVSLPDNAGLTGHSCFRDL